jgi:adenosylcobinamide kinase/adenosylcobinamide-phosphate guanylyltransferase
MVTNEVGLGIVPDNALARRYRDLVGRCNQEIAGAAEQVIMTICGIPLNIKEKK